jgi:1,4-alpha-glucan branching enzyme
MPTRPVQFHFLTGLRRPIFHNARLVGSWDQAGRYADQWTESPMQETLGDDGCPSFSATLPLDLADRDRTFNWGVVLDGPLGANLWGLPTELQDVNSSERHRAFQLQPPAPGDGTPQIERYHLTYCRRLGANKHFAVPGAPPGLRFAVWAPNAQAVAVVFAQRHQGYIADDGSGLDPAHPPIPLTRQANGIWASAPQPSFAAFEGRPYMYRITNAQGATVYRTDIFSRLQVGRGSFDPGGQPLPPGQTCRTLDGTVSCSLVVDPDTIGRAFVPGTSSPGPRVPIEEFWANEFSLERPVPNRVEDLVIYELHVGSLGFGRPRAGNLTDARHFLDQLVALGVNAVELLPLAEFKGTLGWGYGDSHHFVIESSAGGRDQYRRFVRACHRRGLAVIQDVVYNHYDPSAERAQWQYDSTAPEQNIYYWYEGRPTDYRSPDGGYVDNGSSGWAPRYWEEVVRQQFISSAACLVEELHVDGLRVDLTQALHRDNALHADGRPLGNANVFGQKLLREWSRTLRMIRPNVMLIAEDHTGWPAVTSPPAAGGLGFDATWYADFYHNLIGDQDQGAGTARLLRQAGFGGDEPLALDTFASALANSPACKVVYHESHDEAGNAPGTARTIVTAVNHAPLVGPTRLAAEARARVVFGLSLLSAGTPMFLMGEEIGAQKPFTFDTALANREDFIGDRHGFGAALFRYYQDLITLSHRLHSVRTHNLDILHAANANRVLAFKRWEANEEVIVVASLNNRSFASGYTIQKDLLAIPNAGWKEIFNSAAAIYGGSNVGNAGATIPSHDGRLTITIPAVGLLVFVRQ